MHLICYIGTLLLFLIPYVLSQAINGLRTATVGNGRLLNCTLDQINQKGLEKVEEENFGNATFNCSCSAAAVTAGSVVLLEIRPEKDEYIAHVREGASDRIDCKAEPEVFTRIVVMEGKFLGRDNLLVTVRETGQEEREMVGMWPVSVIRKYSVLDTVFIVVIALLVGINTVNMGCHLDLAVVKDNIQRPCAIAIGFTSQYVFMPLMAFGMAMALFGEPNLQLGLFTMGCSPGGGASNFWTLLLEGDTNLSITMTFLSTALALAMMPLWLFTLGRRLFGTMQIRVPFANILISLISLVGPLAVGVLIRRYRPQWADKAVKCIRPFTVIMMLFIFTFGIYTNVYMFYVMSWRTMLAGLVVPWAGYIFGAALAVISKRTRQQLIAISVETGVQNTGVAIVLLKYSLPQPDADLASVLPVCGSIMLFIPLFLWFLGLTFYNWKCKKGVTQVSTEEGSLAETDCQTPTHDSHSLQAQKPKSVFSIWKPQHTLPLPPSQQQLLKENL